MSHLPILMASNFFFLSFRFFFHVTLHAMLFLLIISYFKNSAQTWWELHSKRIGRAIIATNTITIFPISIFLMEHNFREYKAQLCTHTSDLIKCWTYFLCMYIFIYWFILFSSSEWFYSLACFKNVQFSKHISRSYCLQGYFDHKDLIEHSIYENIS